MDGWRSSSVSYRDHRWQVRARVGRAEADDGHKRQLHLGYPEMRSCQDGALGGSTYLPLSNYNTEVSK